MALSGAPEVDSPFTISMAIVARMALSVVFVARRFRVSEEQQPLRRIFGWSSDATSNNALVASSVLATSSDALVSDGWNGRLKDEPYTVQ